VHGILHRHFCYVTVNCYLLDHPICHVHKFQPGLSTLTGRSHCLFESPSQFTAFSTGISSMSVFIALTVSQFLAADLLVSIALTYLLCILHFLTLSLSPFLIPQLTVSNYLTYSTILIVTCSLFSLFPTPLMERMTI
jgi:hypothetical protein